MFRTLSKGFKRDQDYSERTYELSLYRAVLDGRIYENLKSDFHEERNGAGEYMPLRQRIPSVRYNICAQSVKELAACLFDESRFPSVFDEDKDGLSKTCQSIIRNLRLTSVMQTAVIVGSVGSVALHFRILNGRMFWNVMRTEYLTPAWRPDAPDELSEVVELYKIKGSAVAEMGFEVKPFQENMDFWFKRRWTDEAEEWFVPVPCIDEKTGAKIFPTKLDKSRTVQHGLGFVPIVWIKTPGVFGTDCIDGPCIFAGAIDSQIEIEYQLSQLGRGLKYSSDPLLMVKEPAISENSFVRTGANALVVSKEGDAKLLEIGGGASDAVIEFCRYVRQCALEVMRMNRADPQKMTTAQSGRALEMMNQQFIGLLGEFRTAFGDCGLIPMLKMVLAAARVVPIFLDGKKLRPRSDERLFLKWASFFPMTAQEEQFVGLRIRSDFEAGLISRETAVGRSCDFYDQKSVQNEIAMILADQKEEDRRLAAQQAQVKATEHIED